MPRIFKHLFAILFVILVVGCAGGGGCGGGCAGCGVTPLAEGFKPEARVENAGVEPHDLVMMKLAPGKTVADLVTALNPERARRADQRGEQPPPLESLGKGAGGIAAIAPGMQSFFEANLSSREYALVCMATAPDGRSHIEHGMVKQIRVP